mgnify:CR=1 FL=1
MKSQFYPYFPRHLPSRGVVAMALGPAVRHVFGPSEASCLDTPSMVPPQALTVVRPKQVRRSSLSLLGLRAEGLTGPEAVRGFLWGTALLAGIQALLQAWRETSKPHRKRRLKR